MIRDIGFIIPRFVQINVIFQKLREIFDDSVWKDETINDTNIRKLKERPTIILTLQLVCNIYFIYKLLWLKSWK